MQNNPYKAPNASVKDHVDPRDDAEAIREAHVRHEVLLKSVGSLYGLVSFATLLAAVAMFAVMIMGSERDGVAFATLGGLIYLGLGAATGFMAWGFRTLKPWVKIPGTILSGIGLLGIPVGTMINGYILYLIWCAQGQRVLSPDYRDIIARTPHVRYRRTVGDWIALGIVVLGLLGLAVLIVMSFFG